MAMNGGLMTEIDDGRMVVNSAHDGKWPNALYKMMGCQRGIAN
jgi:hypothetical protein